MQQIIHTTKFNCELCSKEIVMPVYGDQIVQLTSEDEAEFVDWCRHFHWVYSHRVCAICGDLIISGELAVAENDGNISIDKGYTDEYARIKRGDKFGPLLMVHEKCIEAQAKN